MFYSFVTNCIGDQIANDFWSKILIQIEDNKYHKDWLRDKTGLSSILIEHVSMYLMCERKG